MQCRIVLRQPFEFRAALQKRYYSLYGWDQNGASKYRICGIDDEKLVLEIITQAPLDQKEFYFVDAGAGEFQWVENLFRFLSNNPDIPKNKKYHIIGLNAEGKDDIKHIDNFSIYKLGDFKTENMLEAFAKREINLSGKVDLIVSQWTLRHLIDALGTFLQMLYLVKTNGYILLEGIPFLRIDTNGNYIYRPDFITSYNLNAQHLLRELKLPYLMCPTNKNSEEGLRDILIKKNEIDPSTEIPLSYSDSLGKDGRLQIWPFEEKAQLVAKNPSKLTSKIKSTHNYAAFDGDKNLHNMLIKKDLFFKHDCHWLFCNAMNSHFDRLDFVPNFILSAKIDSR